MHTATENDQPPRVLLTVEQAAEQLAVSRTYMFRLIKNNAIETVKVGRLRRVPTEALVTYVRHLAAQQRPAAA